MEEILIQRAQTFGSQHQLQLAERLGFGIHRIIFVAEGKSTAGKTALKVHRFVEPYLRACSFRLVDDAARVPLPLRLGSLAPSR